MSREIPTLGFIGKEIVNLGDGPVVGNDVEAVVVDVQNEVLALLEGIYGENLSDMEVANFTMTAKPMRPISPLGIDKGGEQDRKRHGKIRGHTLVQTLSTVSFTG